MLNNQWLHTVFVSVSPLQKLLTGWMLFVGLNQGHVTM